MTGRRNRWRLSIPMMDLLCHINYEPTVVHWDEKQGFFLAQARCAGSEYLISFPYDARRSLCKGLLRRGLISLRFVGKTAINCNYLVSLTEEGKEAARFAWWHKFSKDGGWRLVSGEDYKRLKQNQPSRKGTANDHEL